MSRFTFSAQPNSHNSTDGGDYPERLKEFDQWVVTSEKKPLHPSSGWQKGSNQLTFEDAYQKAIEVGGGIAFCFMEDGPFIGFDLDDVVTNGRFTQESLDIVSRLDSYTEVSSSGTGLHVIAEGSFDDERKHRGPLNEAGHIEVYDSGRYFVLTGAVYNRHYDVISGPLWVSSVQRDVLPPKQRFTFREVENTVSTTDTDVTPQQVYETIRAYVKSSEHDVDRDVLSLWEGRLAGRSSESEADMAFVKQLYYWCKADPQLMDACFRVSELMRPKWDYTRGDKTYGQMTIAKVCESDTDVFGGDYV
jgi:primase-polymerase (primpol)-like protein